MALTDNQTTAKEAIKTAFADKMEELFPLDENMGEGDKNNIRANWAKLGEAVAEALGPVCTHITDNAEIGTVESEVSGSVATQTNTGTGLLN